MRIFVDTASLYEIELWDKHPWVGGFTTNPTLMKDNMSTTAWDWAKEAVALTDKSISIDGPKELWDLGPNVYRKVAQSENVTKGYRGKTNHTAICTERQLWSGDWGYNRTDIISVFAGRIMDTGRNPQRVIDAALETGAQVLWASVREPFNIVQADRAGCDIVTVPPAIFRKYLDWHGKPLEVVADETIAQFERDRDGLW